jgi:NADH:ubiquinone oxidoreductase subunit E
MSVAIAEDQEKLEQLKKVIEEMKDKEGPLIPIMHEAQSIFGYLSYDAQKCIAEALNIPMSEVYGVATFYSYFKTQPKGEHLIGICMGTPCYVRGATSILDKITEEIGIGLDQTTPDNKFTLEVTGCMGCCGLAPIIVIDEDIYGNLTPDDIPQILDKYRA